VLLASDSGGEHESSLYEWAGDHGRGPAFLRVSLNLIKTPFLYGSELTSCSDCNSYMEHYEKVLAAAALLVKRHGQKAPEIARQWARELTKRRDAEAADVCLQIANAANELLTDSAAREPALADVLSGAVTGQMMRADQVERRDVEKLMKNAKRRRRAKRRSRPDHAA
jgi:hypothetical protein